MLISRWFKPFRVFLVILVFLVSLTVSSTQGNCDFVNATERVPVTFQVEDDIGKWGIGEKLTHYLKDNINGSNLFRLSNEPGQHIAIYINVRGLGLGNIRSRYFAIATMWISNTSVNGQIVPIFIAHQLSIYKYNSIKEVAEDILVKTISIKKDCLANYPMLYDYLYWWP